MRTIDISVYMVSCNMTGRGKAKTKKFGQEDLGRPKPSARKCERRKKVHERNWKEIWKQIA